MKRYLLTNPRYTGEVILLYTEDGVLQKMDFSQTNMTATMINPFKVAVPSHSSLLQTSFKSDTIIVESEIVITFEQFWKKYDHKYNKDRCEALWKKMSKTNQVLAYYGLDKYHRFLKKNPEHYKLYPDTYLRTKAWLNDYK